MDVTVSLRLFNIDQPAETMENAGAMTIDDSGELTPYPPETYQEAFERYMDEELQNYRTEKPAPQAVYGDIVVVLERISIDVVEDDIKFQWVVKIKLNRAFCTSKTDTETGLTAEKTVSEMRIANGFQRSGDAVDYHFGWFDVTTPNSLSGVVEAASDPVSHFDDDRDSDHSE